MFFQGEHGLVGYWNPPLEAPWLVVPFTPRLGPHELNFLAHDLSRSPILRLLYFHGVTVYPPWKHLSSNGILVTS